MEIKATLGINQGSSPKLEARNVIIVKEKDTLSKIALRRKRMIKKSLNPMVIWL